VVLEAHKEGKTIHELGDQFDLHPQLIMNWKRHFMEHSSEVFDKGHSSDSQDKDNLIDRRSAQIGQLKVECDFLKKI